MPRLTAYESPFQVTLKGVAAGLVGTLVMTSALQAAAMIIGRVKAATVEDEARRPVIVHDVKDVAALFASVDLAIAAAGSTAWELAAMGVPMLLVAVADTQRVVIDPLVAAGAAERLGLEAAKDEGRLAGAIQTFVRAGPSTFRTMARAGEKLVDGRGAERICRALVEIAAARTAQRDPKERA